MSSVKKTAPLLPGFTFQDPTQTRFPRSQTLSKTAGRGDDAEEVSEDDLRRLQEQTKRLAFQTTTRRETEKAALPIRTPAHIPAYVALDKKVLTFDGYFKETVTESAEEHFRVRRVKIYYHLEDDTMSVLEPPVPNSGLPQGKLIRRQRLPKDARGNTWSWKDLNVGMNLPIYGRVFRVTDCDAFTKEFLLSNGIELNATEQVPEDPYTVKRKVVEQPSTLATTKSDFDKLKQFIELDRKVLRFYCVWDDRANLYGELRPFTLLYFLVDDTIEIREQHQPNDGRDNFPLLLRRQRVPKNPKNIPRAFPKIVMEPSQEEEGDYIGPEDLGIGARVFILGRELLLCDCDEFTREFYRRNFNVEDFTPIDVEDPLTEDAPVEIPPHTGFGTHEDSMQSVLALQPKPPKADIGKLLKYDNKSLRFSARMKTENPIDAERRFIVSYHLSSDTISIFEPRSRETHGGKFLEATRVRKPGCDKHNPVYYGDFDLYPGMELEVFGRTFVLEDCDKFVLKFIQENAHQYPQAALDQLSKKYNILFDTNTDAADALDSARKALRDRGFSSFDLVHKRLAQLDANDRGVLHQDTVYDTCLEIGLPLGNGLMTALLGQCDVGEGMVDYRRFVDMLARDDA
ncbi:EFHC1 protein [Salpingoeca rosetta]|uniref:EFHC1 protein n=1 Tax=Salpingoeca rosetta (strain ATCC 50818 / BSB-021) TaxID=946362 RepID=F2UH95_SALR5|nr:EFHC1 protein [Salpingoeca rosetta]EGD76494.1 EFHC1 protein [Salpingoeca rosetta]|eukprot:XP_004991408.1 EFHC1 protein [Salpingoeca rosetta]